MRLVMYTLWGVYQTYPEILDNIDLPEEMDKTTMLDNIFMYAGENEARYSDPFLMERLVKRWFSARKHDFSMMWRALHAEYNPIENTDRYEDYWRTFDRTGNGKEGRNGTNRSTRNGNQTSNITGTSTGTGDTNGKQSRTPNLTAEETTSAFDSEVYQPYKKRVDGGTEETASQEHSSSSANTTQNGTVTDNETIEGTENTDITRNESVKDEEKHGLHSHGNIGITTNQEMINEELELRRYDLYKQIALLFEDEFTVPVYERRCNEYGML